MAWMKSFRASHGVTVESRGVWNRIDCAVEIELSEGDDSEEVKKKAWGTVYREIENQLLELEGEVE